MPTAEVWLPILIAVEDNKEETLANNISPLNVAIMNLDA